MKSGTTAERSVRWLFAMLLVLGAQLAIVPRDAAASPPAPAAIKALGRISLSKPCAAAALLYVMLKTDNTSSGVFYLPGLATSTEIAHLIDLEDRAVEDFPVQPNLYGEVAFYTRVQWSLATLNDRVIMVTTEASLVSAAGVTLEPAHVIEPRTQALLVENMPRVLPAGGAE